MDNGNIALEIGSKEGIRIANSTHFELSLWASDFLGKMNYTSKKK